MVVVVVVVVVEVTDGCSFSRSEDEGVAAIHHGWADEEEEAKEAGPRCNSPHVKRSYLFI